MKRFNPNADRKAQKAAKDAAKYKTEQKASELIGTTPLKPGLLVGIATRVRGNVSYTKEVLEREHLVKGVGEQATWQTTRTVVDPAENEEATRVRSKARHMIASICAQTQFGLICSNDKTEELYDGIAAARSLVKDFNSRAKVTHISVSVLAGQIAANDAEAVRAINGEVSMLIDTMEAGLRKLDPEMVRDAARKAKAIGSMLTPEAQAKITIAIETARKCATRIIKAGELAADEVDKATLRQLKDMRSAFVDTDDVQIAAPKSTGRAIELAPDEEPETPPTRNAGANGAARQIEV